MCKFKLIFKVLNKHKDKLIDLQNLWVLVPFVCCL